jgi:hypothetical protein
MDRRQQRRISELEEKNKGRHTGRMLLFKGNAANCCDETLVLQHFIPSRLKRRRGKRGEGGAVANKETLTYRGNGACFAFGNRAQRSLRFLLHSSFMRAKHSPCPQLFCLDTIRAVISEGLGG